MQQLHGKMKYNEVVDAEYIANASGVQILLSSGAAQHRVANCEQTKPLQMRN